MVRAVSYDFEKLGAASIRALSQPDAYDDLNFDWLFFSRAL